MRGRACRGANGLRSFLLEEEGMSSAGLPKAVSGYQGFNLTVKDRGPSNSALLRAGFLTVKDNRSHGISGFMMR